MKPTTVLILGLSSMVSNLTAQQTYTPPLDNTPGEYTMAPSNDESNRLAIELNFDDAGLFHYAGKIPAFPGLATYTPEELSALEDSVFGLWLDGKPITSMTPFRQSNRLAVSTAHALQNLGTTGDKPIVTALDENGQPTLDPDFYIIEQSGEVYCTIDVRISRAHSTPIQPRFQLVLDVSGSMEGAINDVKKASKSFMRAMPKNAQCRVIQFADQPTILNAERGHNGWQSCNPSNWAFNDLEADGNTNTTLALTEAYQGFSAAPPVPKGTYTVDGMLVVSDGIDEDIDVPNLKKLKGDTGTLVYFAGDAQIDTYRGWVEEYISAANGIDVGDAFSRFADLYAYARVIDPASCKPKT